MQRQKLIAPVATLMYTFSKSEFVCSLLVMSGVALFSFFYASDSVAGAQTGSYVSASIWHRGDGWIRAFLGDEQWRVCSRCIGCVCAGFAAAVFFVVIRHFLFYLIGKLRLVEYYRVRTRLFSWTMCVVLSFTLSQFFIELLTPVTQVTVNVVLVSLAVWLSILYLRVKWPIFLCAAFALLGTLSAVSITGVIMLIVVTMILFFAGKSQSQCVSGYGYDHENAYGVGYGSYCVSQDAYGTTPYGEVETDEPGLTANALLAERFRLLLLLSFIMGFVFTLTLVFGYGMFSGEDVRDIVLQWLSCFGAELKGMLTAVELMALACCVAIAFLFVNYRLARMFDIEYYLKTKDLIRIGIGFFLACVVLICIGRRIPFVAGPCLCEMSVLPLAIQVIASEVILEVAAIFLVNLKCRKIYPAVTGDVDDTKVVRQYKWMRVLLLLFFDLLPVFLLAMGIGRIWSDFP